MRVHDVDVLLPYRPSDRADGSQRLVGQRDEGIEWIEIVTGQRRLEPIGERQQVPELRGSRNVRTYRRNDATAECFGDVEHCS